MTAKKPLSPADEQLKAYVMTVARLIYPDIANSPMWRDCLDRKIDATTFCVAFIGATLTAAPLLGIEPESIDLIRGPFAKLRERYPYSRGLKAAAAMLKREAA